MASQKDQLTGQVQALQEEVAGLRRRVEDVEEALSCGAAFPVARGFVQSGEIPERFVPEKWSASELIGHFGRTLVILGGAFLLRAVSQAAVLTDPAGPLLGLLYALAWIAVADRVRSARQQTSALFFGLSGLAIAYPLLWETTVRFGRMPDSLTGPAIVFFCVAALAVSWRRTLRPLAWIGSGGAVLCSVAVMLGTRHFATYTGVLVALAAVTEFFALTARWSELRWAPAAALNVTLLLLAVLVTQPRLSPEIAANLAPGLVVVLALLAPAVYLTSVATVTLARRRAITPFEILQVSASLVLGVGTALAAIACHGGNQQIIALALLAIGLLCYGVSFATIDHAEHPARNFYAYTTFAGLLVATGSALDFAGVSLAATWAILGAIGIAAGVLRDRNTMRTHGALFLAAASLPSGLAAAGLHGLLGPLEGLHPAIATPAVVIALALATAYGVLALAHRDAHWSEGVPRLLVAGALVWGVAGIVAPPLAALVLAMGDNLDRMAYLASTRTAVLSVTVAACAWAARRFSLGDLAWLIGPIMVVALLRMAWEDLAYGGPVNLFLALGFYGGALIATSQLLRKPDAD